MSANDMRPAPSNVSSFGKLVQTIRRWFGRKPEPEDPYAGVRVPLRKGPGGRSAAATADPPRT